MVLERCYSPHRLCWAFDDNDYVFLPCFWWSVAATRLAIGCNSEMSYCMCVCVLRTSSEWVNPGQYGLIVVTSSEGRNLPYGKLEDILTRDSTALNCHTNDDKYVYDVFVVAKFCGFWFWTYLTTVDYNLTWVLLAAWKLHGAFEPPTSSDHLLSILTMTSPLI